MKYKVETIQIQKFIRLIITTITTSNARAFKEFLRPLSVLHNSTARWSICIIYASKGALKMLWCALYFRCALFIENMAFRIPSDSEYIYYIERKNEMKTNSIVAC
jgi:hypothetical protein